MTDAARVLTGLGFTGLEAEIYAFLVRESPATGYRIAQAINKPVANTYKAIQTLHEKGAIEIEDGESRLCRAVPSNELLDRLGREFATIQAEAKQLLGRLGKPAVDERIYQLRTRGQVLQRAREMVQAASSVLLLSLPEAEASELADVLTAAAGRGVQVFVKADADLSIPSVDTYVAREDDLVVSAGFLRVVADGELSLTAHLEGTRATALTSRSPALALALHEGLAAEISLLAVADRVEEGAGAKRISKALATCPAATSTPGFNAL